MTMWHEGVYEGYWWQAKVSHQPSRFGINSGRIIKLCICKGLRYDHTQVLYNYERNLDVNNCPPRRP